MYIYLRILKEFDSLTQYVLNNNLKKNFIKNPVNSFWLVKLLTKDLSVLMETLNFTSRFEGNLK
jgi:hypothetical protein